MKKLLQDTYVLGVLGLCVLAVLVASFPPALFPHEPSVVIEDGATVSSVARDLYDQSIISSPILFRFLVAALAPKSGVIAGEYAFSAPVGLFAVARAVTDPTGGNHTIRLTIPEGLNNREIAEIARQKLGEGFKIDTFLLAAAKEEGYLFPDTYFVPKNLTPKKLVQLMRDNFDAHIVEIKEEIENSGRTLDELVNMAAILEGEAYTESSMRKVAGVLWHRIEIDMPLQVDAVFKYFLGRTTFDLTLEDLGHESLYNTYDNKGLPPTPINNPGLAAIRAAATPEETDALFYLTGKDGIFYFAKTFEEHKANKFKYLE